MTYPKRGEMSDDGKFYTHTDGSVFARIQCPFTVRPYCKTCRQPIDCQWLSYIEGAYVPSDEEQDACDMARAMIVNCSTHYYWSRPMDIRTCEHNLNHCHSCSCLTAKSCPARAYLAAHGDANAWEVK